MKSYAALLLLLRRIVHLLRRFYRPLLALVCVAVLLDLLFTFSSTAAPKSSIRVPVHAASSATAERIFVASLHWNGETLIREHWAPAVLDLARHFGKDNVYFSVLEGGSGDDAKAALRELGLELEKLGIGHHIELDDTTHTDAANRVPVEGEKGWVYTPRGKKELRRIPYLAGLRNRAMVKLRELAAQEKTHFDKVLWLNDIIFSTADVVDLLATHDGDYAAACALDFSDPPLYYDTFSLRDSDGARTISMTWPYFLSSRSRSAMSSGRDAVPVESCWNGMVVFDARPFYSSPALQFRGLPDSLAAPHLEASECCLIHMDNPLSAQKGVYLNPNVRVGYNSDAFKAVHPKDGWPSRWQRIVGTWRTRWARWTGWPQRELDQRIVDSRIRMWMRGPLGEGEELRSEVGGLCAVNEMQVLVHNGWEHV